HELKGLILQLAIQGKLTSNWRNENPDVLSASALLKQIKEEKLLLLKRNKIKNEKPLPILKDTAPFELPIKWKWSNLGDLGYAQTGTTPPTKNPENYGTFIPFLGPADISNSLMQYPIDGLSEEGLRKGRLIDSNSLMMVCIGGSMGKCNINRKDVSCNQQINILTPICSPVEYIKIICQSPYFQTEVWGRATGSATPMINKNKWLQIPISVPPLEEQKAIVSIVETLFKEVEQLEQLTVERISLKEKFVASALDHLTTNNAQNEWAFLQEHFHSFFNETINIKKLRETVLQLAVQGKLTADWRLQRALSGAEVEDASVLLKRIQKEKEQLIKDKKLKKENSLPPITKYEVPYELPDGWVWCRMQEVGLFERGKSKHRPRNDFRLFAEGIYPLVQTGDVSSAKKSGGIIKTHKSAYNDFGLAQSRMWDKGTLCITIAANIAETGFLGFNACFPDSVVGFSSLLDDSVAQYVEYFVNVMKSDLEKYAPSTAQKNINLGILYELKFPLPPIEEQKAIVQKVNALMGLCDALEQQVQQSQEQSEQLMQSCLREVFEGKREVENEV
ncbi:restriction endonuclease subunit S, partial [Xanthomarina gelatinilytica]|uniref:restriction endonuclease subunit S n=1 Tax=Xanthomarina gelatinilytica TaxID=1137281 RepID=UPI003AA94F09